MKVWQCMALLGMSLGFTMSEAQESSAQQAEASAQQEQGAAAQDHQAQQEQEKTLQDPPAQQEWSVDALFGHVMQRAESLAGEGYQPPQSSLPEALRNLGYDDYRDIRFREGHALWRDERLFEAQFFHPGFLYDIPVEIHALEDGQLSELEFDPEMFRYEGETSALRDTIDELDPEALGFAGFRLHYPLNRPDYKDELSVFLGASYFRLLGRGQSYGLSARGLAVDTATQEGEEFPTFRAFWLVKPEENASRITLFALLDSPSVTGAYRFDIQAGGNTVVNVDSRLYARSDVGKLGLAPLTSMFMHGEHSTNTHDDFRPEVHDSDGLLMETASGQWIWRPLSNPNQLKVTQLRDHSPRGFGLMQRDRDFESYMDTESAFQQRPSVWINPGEGDWGEGGLELVEIPSDSESNDNIVAYWVADGAFRAGESRRYQYRLSTYEDRIPEHRLGRVIRTFNGWGAIPGTPNPPPHSLRRFVIDFQGGDELSSLAASQPVDAELNVSSGEVSDLVVRQLPDGETWRATFKLAPQGDEPADMQLRLMMRGAPLTETWSYNWNPNDL